MRALNLETTPSKARNVPCFERRETRLVLHTQRGREHGLESRVSCAAALNRIDELRDAKAALRETTEQRQEADERTHAHRAGDHSFTSLPDHDDDAGHHQRAVKRWEPEPQPRRAEVALGKG